MTMVLAVLLSAVRFMHRVGGAEVSDHGESFGPLVGMVCYCF